MSHALTLATMCTQPGCGAFGSVTDDDTAKRVCPPHAMPTVLRDLVEDATTLTGSPA